MDGPQPLFSVVIPVYNRAHLVGATLDSLDRQTFRDFEVIAVDDGSTDSSVEALRKRGGRIQVVCQENGGQALARNVAMRVARGRYIVFLDSDDLLLPWALESYRDAVEGEEPAVLLGQRVYFHSEGALAGLAPGPASLTRHEDYLESQRRRVDLVGAPTLVVLRSAALAVGGFAEVRCHSEDIDFALRLGVARGCVRLLTPPVVAVRKHDQNVTLDSGKTLEGLDWLISREYAGAYPGGSERRRDRINILGFQVRCISMGQAKRGSLRRALHIYFRGLGWHARLCRWRFILGFPLLFVALAVRRVLP